MTQTIQIGADILVQWEEPVDEADGAFIGTDAVGLVTLKTSAGLGVTGAVDLAATYQAGPPRRYQATIPNTVDLTEGSTYYIEFSLTAADGTPHGFRRLAVVAGYEE